MNRILSAIGSWYKNYCERRRLASEKSQNEIIECTFNVIERGGNLYLMCGNKAVSKVEDNATAKEIVERIEASRKAFKDYNKENGYDTKSGTPAK